MSISIFARAEVNLRKLRYQVLKGNAPAPLTDEHSRWSLQLLVVINRTSVAITYPSS